MFFPFTNYKKIDVSVGNQTDIYTTTAKSMIIWQPLEQFGIAQSYIVQTEDEIIGGLFSNIIIFQGVSGPSGLGELDPSSELTTIIIDAGRVITLVRGGGGGPSAGTLYVFELP